MRERDLRASLAEIGPLISGLEWAGTLVDGRRKAAICREIGKRFDVHRARTLKEACSILWTRHPSRALELAGKRSVLELAELCSTSTTAIAAEIAAQKPPKKRMTSARIIRSVDYPKVKERRRMARLQLVLEPELVAYAKEAAAQAGHNNVSKLARKALWRAVVELVPNAPQFQPKRCEPYRMDSRAAKRARRARGR